MDFPRTNVVVGRGAGIRRMLYPRFRSKGDPSRKRRDAWPMVTGRSSPTACSSRSPRTRTTRSAGWTVTSRPSSRTAFEMMDPTMLTDDLRRAWTARATRPDERIESPHERAWYLSPFWLLDAGERVGTIALANSLAGADVVSVRSLYVTPRHRRRGIAGRALRRSTRCFAPMVRGASGSRRGGRGRAAV